MPGDLWRSTTSSCTGYGRWPGGLRLAGDARRLVEEYNELVHWVWPMARRSTSSWRCQETCGGVQRARALGMADGQEVYV
ncbi:hypothetical protein NDU88_010820 [Pleurodeles waltl]|uniref:Uncharacterized protein n=1 Tax=Pleurodeles waltl TaxID=8319 RepID=A0AAV7S2H3_PLEWA|nr:hypothetical protein NDU88_010820 [Pleurodeles waltl]